MRPSIISVMATKKDSESTENVGTPKGAGMDVVAVTPKTGDDANEEYLKEQNEAYYRTKLTGVVGDWVDPTRDQEPDIAPEFGVSPHPELANPRAPEGTGVGLGVNLDASKNPVLQTVEEKDKKAKEVDKHREDAKKAAVKSTAGTEQQADKDSPATVDPGLGEGSPTVAQGDARAKE